MINKQITNITKTRIIVDINLLIKMVRSNFDLPSSEHIIECIRIHDIDKKSKYNDTDGDAFYDDQVIVIDFSKSHHEP